MAASTDELLQIVLDVDLSIEPGCEFRDHGEQPEWHDGPAGYWCIGPHGRRNLVCSKWATAAKWLGADCGQCGDFHAPDDFTFIQL